MSDYAAPLEASGVEPGIDQGEFLATMIDLPVLETRRPAVVENRHVLIAPIPYCS